VTRVPLQARVLVRAPLQALDRLLVLAIAVAALLLVLALAIATRTTSTESALVPRASLPLGGAALGLLLLFLASQVETPGSALTLAKGLALALLQVGSALLLARWLLGRELRDVLASHPPAARSKWAFFAVICAAGLVLAARASLALVPATGEAPIQAFVSWPSGMLSFAALGVILPVGEEVFFRGYLYRAALVLGRLAAFGVTSVAFVLLHAPQSWGNWGGLLAIAVTGVALTALRAASGSLLVPLLTHLLYNFVLSFGSF
jgi:membrane protease YdiL (CAAX protease family)